MNKMKILLVKHALQIAQVSSGTAWVLGPCPARSSQLKAMEIATCRVGGSAKALGPRSFRVPGTKSWPGKALAEVCRCPRRGQRAFAGRGSR